MPSKEYHLPVIPFSPIDALNRRAAAVGSIGYAEAASHANYNGHGAHRGEGSPPRAATEVPSLCAGADCVRARMG